MRVQAAWRGYIERKRIQREYERLLEEEEAFQEAYRGSIINRVGEISEEEEEGEGMEREEME